MQVFADILDLVDSFSSTIVKFAQVLIQAFSTPFGEFTQLFADYANLPALDLFAEEINLIVQATGIGDLNLITVLFGGGIIFIIGYSFVTWWLNLIT